ncbi:putative chromatin regulator PHD family [Helianthus annuus]|nr:putative chromatin regulator PHD family [Helianthus annuus]
MEIQSLHLLTHIVQRIFVSIFSTIVSFILVALSHIRLYKPPPQHSDHHVVILDGSSMSLIHVPINVVIVFIKNKIPIIPYSDLAHRAHTALCMVCLEHIDGSHSIRELLSCDHVFHLECLDAWIDVGRVTCPLCRSMLLPPKKLLSYSNSV